MTHELMRDFDVTATALGVLVSFYYASYVALQIPCGLFVDKMGPRRIITFSAIICVLGCFFFAYSSSLLFAQIGRFLMGAGSACAYLSAAKITTEWFPVRYFAVISAISMFMGTLGGSFGASPFAILVNHGGWRLSMIQSGICGGVIALIVWFVVRDRPVSQNSNLSKDLGFLEGLKVITSNPQSWLIGLYGCTMYLPLSAFAELWGVPFMMERYHLNNEDASFASILVFIGMGIGSVGSAWLSDVLKSRKKIMSASAWMTCVLFTLVFYASPDSLTMTFILLFMVGLVSGGQILYFAAAKEINPIGASATAIGFTNFFVMVSGLIFQPLLGAILDGVWKGGLRSDGTRLYTFTDYQQAFSVVIVAFMVSFILVYFIRETHPDKKS